MNPALAAEGYFHPLWRPFPQVVQPCSKSLKMKWAEQAATAKPQCPRPGSPHSKKLKLLTCAAGTIGFRASTPKYCLWNQNGTPPHALALAAWRQAPGHGFHTLRNPFRCTRPGLSISPATGTAAPQCPRPGSPHSKKRKLLACAADTTGFRTSTPKYCLWNQNGTAPHALALATGRQTPGHAFQILPCAGQRSWRVEWARQNPASEVGCSL
jgi:hypothetical protein